MKIKNSNELATTPERRIALQIAEKGLEAIDTHMILDEYIGINADTLSVFGKEFQLNRSGKLIAVCIGKCAKDAAFVFEKILGNRLSSGIALGVGEASPLPKKIKYYAGTHPMPSEANVIGTKAILDSLVDLYQNDTVLFLISGGGSTLLTQPSQLQGVTLEESMLEELFKVGATIQEINTVRKHISLARGGFLAAQAYPAQVISIIFSDVPGNNPGFISSGPTVKDTTTVEDAEQVLTKYKLNALNEYLIETPKDDRIFERVYNILALSSDTAINTMKESAESFGYSVIIKDTSITGEARKVAENIAEEINAARPGIVHLYSGETTVTLKAKGRGGRNQELALAALPDINEHRLILSLASDGHDNGPHAGAIADTEISNRAKSMDMDPNDFLERNESSTFFEAVGGLVETRDTGSNVSDLIIAISGK